MAAPGPPLVDLDVGALVAGRFRVVRRIGGSVYEVSRGGDERLALKVYRRESVSEEALSRFIRAVSQAGVSSNPHLVPVVELGQDLDRDALFIVMPLLVGRDLATLLASTGPLEPRVAIRLACQVCAGLSSAHAAELVHGHLTPSNVFLEDRTDGTVLVRVGDFAVSKRLARGVDERTDVSGVGAVVYEALSGHAPASDSDAGGPTAFGTSLLRHAPWVDIGLARVLARALEDDPTHRFASIDALASRLRGLSDGEAPLLPGELVGVSERVKATTLASSSSTDPGEADPAEPDLPSQDLLVGRSLAGRYRIVRLIGRGGMGSVYEAETEDGERVAAKVILAGLASREVEFVVRFLREGNAISRIDSPHVTRTLDLGTDLILGAPFLVMELLSGVDLRSVLRERGRLPPGAVARVFAQAAKGLVAAHERGIVHRDIKPANLFLHAPDGRVTVKLCDFGLAKDTRAEADGVSLELTATGGVLGSPKYMSPEQALDARTVDGRTDVWSLAVSLFEALTGRSLWPRFATPGELLVAICARPIPRLADVDPRVDPRLARIVDRGLERDPGDRWASAADLLAALEELTGGHDDVTLDELRAADAGPASAREPDPASAGPAGETVALWPSPSRVQSSPPPGLDEAPRPVALRRGWSVLAAASLAIAVVGSLAWRSRGAAGVTPAPAPPASGAPVDAPFRITGAPQVLTSTGACARRPAFLPDGSLVFAAEEGAEHPIYRLDGATGALVRLSEGADEYADPGPGPDGTVVFLRSVSGIDVAEVRTVPAQGGESRLEVKKGGTARAEAGFLYYLRDDSRAVRRRAPGGNPDELLFEAPSAATFDGLALSPGARFLATNLTGIESRPTNAVCVGTVEGRELDCSSVGVSRAWPTFSPSGEALYYVGHRALVRYALGSHEKLSLPLSLPATSLSIAPDASRLVLSACAPRYEWVRVDDPTGSAATPSPTPCIGPPAVDPTGVMACPVDADDHSALGITEPNGSSRILTGADQNVTTMSFSPDGSRLVFLDSTEKTGGLFVVDALGNRGAVRLTRDPGDSAPTWLDDAHVVFLRPEEGRPMGRAYAVPVAGGEPRALPAVPGVPFGSVPARRALVTWISEPSGDSFAECSTDGHVKPLRFEGMPAHMTVDRFLATSPSGRYLTWFTGGGAWRADLQTRRVQRIAVDLAGGYAQTIQADDAGRVYVSFRRHEGQLYALPGTFR